MSNPAIPRDQVHSLSEACGNDPLGFQSIAARLMKDQRRLGRFFEENVSALGGKAAQIGLYMMTVCLRVIDQSGGRLYKVSGEDIAAGSAVRVQKQLVRAMAEGKAAAECVHLHLSGKPVKTPV